MRYLSYLSLLLALFLCAGVSAMPQSAGRIRLEGAGQSKFTVGERGIVSHFWDGVRFSRGEAKLAADSAVYFESEDRIELFGTVSIVEATRSLDADTVFYDHKLGVADAYGNVVIRDYQRHVRLDGGRAQVFETEEALVLWEQPRLILDFDLQMIQTFILADTIKYFAAEQTATAINSVRIQQGTLEATADHATFYTDKEEFCLTGNVQADQRLNRLTGDEMVVFSRDKKLERIEVEGRGESIFRQPARADTIAYNGSMLTAYAIDFNFREDRLELTRAAGNCCSYYNTAAEDAVASCRNVG